MDIAILLLIDLLVLIFY